MIRKGDTLLISNQTGKGLPNYTIMPATRRPSKPEVEEGRYDYPDDVDNALHRARTTGAVSISAELFEKLYLAPKTEVSGQLRRTLGNPTPM